MGYYINNLPNGVILPAKGKAKVLLANGAKLTNAIYQPDLVCVVENTFFDAAGYCYSEMEFEDFKETSRPKTWLIVPGADKIAL